MKINDILKTPAIEANIATETYAIHGLVVPDTAPKHVRIYRDPTNKRSYWLLNVSDIVGDLTEWTSEEKVHAGLIGEKMHKLNIRHGTEIKTVEVTIEKLGESIAGDDLVYGSGASVSGECRSSSGCGAQRCCTVDSRGCRCNACCIA